MKKRNKKLLDDVKKGSEYTLQYIKDRNGGEIPKFVLPPEMIKK